MPRLDESGGAKLPAFLSPRSFMDGHTHSHAPDEWFCVRHNCWLIFYQHHPDGIEVMRVVDAVRDLPRQLRDEI